MSWKKKSYEGGTCCLCQNCLTSSNTKKQGGGDILSSLPRVVYFPPISVPGCGKSELSWNEMEWDKQGFAALAKMSPWPRVLRRDGHLVEGPVHSWGSTSSSSSLFDITYIISALCSLACSICTSSDQNIPSHHRDTVTVPFKQFSMRKCSDRKHSCQSFSPTIVSPVHWGPCDAAQTNPKAED